MTSHEVDTRTASRLTGHTVHMLHYLQRHAILKATHSPGRGSSRRYSLADLVVLKIIKKLVDRGISILSIEKPIAQLKIDLEERQSDHFDKLFLVTDGEIAHLHSELTSLENNIDDDLLILVNVGEVQSKLQDAISIGGL